jgi:hypothetical protein
MDSLTLDVTRFSEDDLIALNRRIIERLQLLRSAKSLAQPGFQSEWSWNLKPKMAGQSAGRSRV